MNIVVISTIYPEPKHFGIADDTLIVHYFTKYWVSQGHRVIVIHPYYNALKNIRRITNKHAHKIVHSVIDGVTIIHGEIQLLIPHAVSPIKWRDIYLAKKMRKYLENKFPDFTPDVVAVHFPIVLRNFTSTFLNGEKSLSVFHGTDIRLLQSRKDIQPSIINQLDKTYRLFLFRSPKLLTKGIALGLNAEKSNTLISGLSQSLIAEKTFIENKINAEFHHAIRVLYAGKIVKQKKISQILKALSTIKDETAFQFDILGEGSELPKLKALALELGIQSNVKFHGAVSRQTVSKMMGHADVFIMTSTNETLGLVYLEAMAQGCITIGSRGEGIDGIIIDSQNGYLVNPNDIYEIAECLRKASKMNIDTKRYLLSNAYGTVMNLTDKAMSEYYISMLENIQN